MQGRPTALILGVDIGPLCNQQLRDLALTAPRGAVQGLTPTRIGVMDVRSLFNQLCHQRQILSASRD